MSDEQRNGDGSERPRSQATQLIELVNGLDLFHDSRQVTYASVPLDGHCETWPLRAKEFRGWLAHRYFETANVAASGAAIRDALTVLEGKALSGVERSSKSPDGPPSGPLVSAGELIGEVAALFRRFIVLPSNAAALAIALYVLHTWAFEAAHATPYLAVRSPVKRAGKTRLEELLELVVRRPWRVTAASEADSVPQDRGRMPNAAAR